MTMRNVRLPEPLGSTSALGIGCASLGSRISRRAGLSALARAHDAGIRWFDVAPSYGDGEAESLLGTFVQGRRSELHICTKVGILPARSSPLLHMAKPVMRSIVAAFPAIRGHVARVRPAPVHQRVDGRMVMSSINASLARLRCDHVDVLALHDASPEDVVREDVLRALERAVSDGKARAVAVASSGEACRAAVNEALPYALVQFANNPFERTLEDLRAAGGRPVGFVTHSVFGTSGALQRLERILAASPDQRAVLTGAGYNGPIGRMASDFLADYAFSTNSSGVTLVSSFGSAHLATNVERVAAPPPRAFVLDLATHLLKSPADHASATSGVWTT